MGYLKPLFKTLLILLILPAIAFAQSSNLTITIVDSAGTPLTVGTLDSVTVACNDFEGLVSVSGQFSTGQSSVVLSIPNNTGVNCIFTPDSHLQGYLLDGSTYVFVSGNVNENMYVTTLNANVSISFVDSSGGPKSVPSGSSAKINCADYSSGITLSQDLNVGDTSVTLQVVGNRSYNCWISGLNGAQGQDLYVYVPSAGTGTGSILISTLDATITLSFQDTKGNIYSVPSSSVSAYVSCYGKTVVNKALEVGAQSVSISVASGSYYYCSGFVAGNPLALGAFIDLNSSTAGSGLLKFAIPDATLNISLVKLSDSTSYTIPSGSYASVYCYGSNGYFSDSVTSGNSSKVIDIVSGTYVCGAYIPGVAVAQSEVTVAVGTTGSVVLGIATRDYTVNVSIRDSSGNLIDVDGVVYAYTISSGISDYVSGTITSGTGSFNAISATYALNLSSSSSTTTSGLILDNADNPYIQSFDISSVTIAGANTSTNLVLIAADATINVSLTGATGSSNWVSAIQETSSTSSAGVSVGGFSDELGQVSLALPAGTYQVFAYSSGSALAPAAQTVTVATGSSASVSIIFQNPDYDLEINASVTDGSTGTFYCSLNSPTQGFYTFSSGGDFGSAVSVGLLSTISEWIISCFGYGQDTDGNFSIYSSNLDLYKIRSGRTSDSINVTLTQVASAINESFKLTSGAGGSVGFQNDDISGEMIVPADAFNSNDSSLNINISNTDTNVHGNDEFSPLPGLTFDVQAEEQDHDEVDLANGKSLIFTGSFEVPEEYDPDSVKVMEYDDNSGSLTELPSEEVDTTSSSIQKDAPIGAKSISKALKVTIKSLVGKRIAVVAKLSTLTLPGPVSKIRVKVKKAKTNNKYKLIVTWEAGDGASSYSVSVLNSKGTKTIKRTTSTETRAVLNNVKLNSGVYKVKVNSVNTLGNGDALKKKFEISD